MARGDDSHSAHLYEKPFFQHIIVLSIIATLIVSVFALVSVYQLKKAIVPKTVNFNDFLKKLTSHAEMKSYVGVAPLNVVQINNNNLGNLQTQINGLDTSYIGSFIVQYTNGVVIYDYDNDRIRGNVNLQAQQAQFPADFFTKLNKHAEIQGLQNQKPAGGKIDEASLNTLKQQFPDVYASAKVGDYLLRYQTKLVIYDYNADKIINTVSLG